MKLTVCWASKHDYQPNRGYWDQGFLEHLFDGRLGRLPDALDFEHTDALGLVNGHDDGAVVILPARGHRGDAAWVNELIRPLKWVLLVLTGDEGAEFPFDELSHPNMATWVQTPYRGTHDAATRRLPDFWPVNCPELLREIGDNTRELDWYFAGQIRDSRRRRLMRDAMENVDGGVFFETPEFGAGLPYREYLMLMVATKCVLAPSGFMTPDTFRCFEALEAGCVPIVETTTHFRQDDLAYWPYVFGEVPFPIIDEWDEAHEVIVRTCDDYPASANRCFAWWQGYKREVATWLLEDIEPDVPLSSPDDLITVVIPTSPVPSNPDASHLLTTLASVRERLPTAEVFVCLDGVRPEQEHLRRAYEDYQREVLWKLNHMPGVVPIRSEAHVHQANLLRDALRRLRTPLVAFVEHDTPLVGEIDFEAVCGALGDYDLVRFYHEAQVHPEHEHLMDPAKGDLIPTRQFSARPHVARADFYRKLLDEFFPPDCRTMIEDRLHSPAQEGRWKMALYAPPGDIKRSDHLDARGEAEKFPMFFGSES